MSKEGVQIKCPRCGYELVIPLKPRDSRVNNVWDVWCPRCGHVWALKNPLRVDEP
ncbi:MAG: hypothetical protein QXO01_05415 [Nitrososphaerota archaeon]